jgi:hypothetical protein
MTEATEAKKIARKILGADLNNLEEAKIGWDPFNNRLRLLCGLLAVKLHASDEAAGEAFAERCRTEADLTAKEEAAFVGHEQHRGYFALARSRLAALNDLP